MAGTGFTLGYGAGILAVRLLARGITHRGTKAKQPVVSASRRGVVLGWAGTVLLAVLGSLVLSALVVEWQNEVRANVELPPRSDVELVPFLIVWALTSVIGLGLMRGLGSAARRSHAFGMQGRAFVGGGPGPAHIEEVTGRPARTPVRVDVGLDQTPSVEERAALAVAELRRTGGFEREVLVVPRPPARAGWNVKPWMPWSTSTPGTPRSQPCSTPICPAGTPSSSTRTCPATRAGRCSMRSTPSGTGYRPTTVPSWWCTG